MPDFYISSEIFPSASTDFLWNQFYHQTWSSFCWECETSNGFLLNDVLRTGPQQLINIFDIIYQFRRYKLVFLWDTRQMYRQMKIAQLDQPYPVVIWHSDKPHPLKFWKLTIGTYAITGN